MKQSTEAAPPPEPAKEFDTKTPANTVVRRFTLNDLPRYGEKLYPHLKQLFPHIHDRMYGGWLRSCIEDNATFFVCGNATVALAKMIHDPLDPRPVVEIVFCLGDPSEFVSMYREIIRWSRDLGARETRARQSDAWEISRSLKHPNTETRKITVFPL